MSGTTSLSYVSTPVTTTYVYQTVIDRLKELADQDPDREAFVFYGISKERTCITRRQLLDQTENAARRLIQVGVKKGSTVMLCMRNSMEMLIMNLAVVMAGGVPFFFAGSLRDGSDLKEFINDLEGLILVIDTNVGDDNWKIINGIWPSSENVCTLAPSLKLILCNGTEVTENSHYIKLSCFLQEQVEGDVEFPVLQPEDILAYFCSSGSTGKPKEIIYSHFGIINWTKMSDITFGITGKSKFFSERTFGWVVGYPRTYLTEGTCRVFVDTRLSMSAEHTEFLCEIIRKENCDYAYLPGYFIVDLLKNPQFATTFQNLKGIIISGERILANTALALKRTYCNNVYIWYGNTEAGGASVFDDKMTDFEDGIIGKPIPGVEMKVVDEYGKVVSVDTRGELCIRCSWRFSGYRNMDDMLRQAVDEKNWFHTGDVAHLRKDGNFVVDGRFKEMISTATLKYFPWSVEKVLKKIEGAEHVFAVGVPDQRLHQVVCACVFPKPDVTITEADVKKFCDEVFLEASTTTGVSLKPRHYVILDKVPLTPSGKIDRRTIGFIAKEKLGL